jgi:1-acyl-sn-glycerol-3-phosphate acyltransferase
MRKFYNSIKIGFIVLLVLINIIQYHLFPASLVKTINRHLIKFMLVLMNVKIKIHGNVEALNNNNVLLMSNHYDGVIDMGVLFDIYYNNNKNNKLYTVVKHNVVGDPNDQSMVSKMMCYVKESFLKSLAFIPYKRGDKEDGAVVKQIITETLRAGGNILIFPEGTTHTDGVPRDFRHGIFKLAIEQKMNILPITLKYNKDIGSERGEPVNFHNIFDNQLDIYIHDLIDSEVDDCYKINDYLALKQKTFDLIGGSTPTPPAGG